MRRSTALPRWILIPLVLSAAAVFAVVALLLATEKRATAAAPDFRVTQIGGLEYQAMQGRAVHPSNAVDRKIIEGLAPGDRRTPHGTLLFGAFISVTNDSARALPTADRIDLRDQHGRVYHPLPLPVSNPYAYSPRLIRPRVRIPAHGTPADDNLAAAGRLLLFRIPARRYEDGGALELVIHDPLQPAHVASLII
jgi:hypothetical protein